MKFTIVFSILLAATAVSGLAIPDVVSRTDVANGSEYARANGQEAERAVPVEIANAVIEVKKCD